MFDELIEAAASLVLLAQFAPSQALEVYLIGLLVVVEEGLLRFIATNGGNGNIISTAVPVAAITTTPA